jgi:hypothetical protein
MINRKQAAELLGNVHARYGNCKSLLEAVYSGSDDATKAVLNANPDLRLKAAATAESFIRAVQDEKDFKAALSKVRSTLDPDLHKDDGKDDDTAEASAG